MAKVDITQYSQTAANNTDIDGIDIDEGCAPSGINNAIRELMAHLADMNAGATALSAIAVDNLSLNGNTLSSTNTNGDINITPDGTGSLVISKVDVAAGEIDDVTIGANSAAAGTFTTFTSTGIDDNATQETLDLTDSIWKFGVSGAAHTIAHQDNTASLALSGGSGSGAGGNHWMYGGDASVTAANRSRHLFRQDATTRIDIVGTGSTQDIVFYDSGGSELMQIDNATGALLIGATSPGNAESLRVVNESGEGDPTFSAHNVAIFQRNLNSGYNAAVSVIAGSAAEARVDFGDNALQGIGSVKYNNSTNTLSLRANNADRVNVTGPTTEITNTLQMAGQQIQRDVNDDTLVISGGDDLDAGANYWLYGGTDALPNRHMWRQNAVTRMEICRSDTTPDILFNDASGVEMVRFDSSSSAVLIGATSPVANELLRVEGAMSLGLSTATLEILDAGTTGATEAGWITVEVGGTAMYLRAYSAI